MVLEIRQSRFTVTFGERESQLEAKALGQERLPNSPQHRRPMCLILIGPLR